MHLAVWILFGLWAVAFMRIATTKPEADVLGVAEVARWAILLTLFAVGYVGSVAITLAGGV